MALTGTCRKKQSEKPTTNGSETTVSVLQKLKVSQRDKVWISLTKSETASNGATETLQNYSGSSPGPEMQKKWRTWAPKKFGSAPAH